MKLQYLAVIFVIVILPITMVVSEFVNNKIEIAKIELEYDTKVLNSTYDAIKAYQLNTVNNSASDVTNLKITDIEAAGTTLYNSLASNFGFTGYRSEVMKEYVPAIVFTMYDGYYIYSPFTNTLTTIQGTDGEPELKSVPTYPEDEANVDPDYADGTILEGLKPYVYYSCRYEYNGNDFVITYTLDNYITVQGMFGGEYIDKSGYLVEGISKVNDHTYRYNDGKDIIEFTDTQTEKLTEQVGWKKASYVGETKSEANKQIYEYVKINGVKYYRDENGKIFFIDQDGTKNYSQLGSNQSTSNQQLLEKYNNAIDGNKSAFEYYKNAYDFTTWVKANLGGLQVSNAYIYDSGNRVPNTTLLEESGNYEIFGGTVDYQYANSNFNNHRQAIIRYVVETNLSTSIASFSSNARSDFLMPKISETDWEIIENEVCAISFVQGLNMGGKKYNGYAVVANTLTKEYVDENDIYILTNDDTYCKANDITVQDGTNIKTGLDFYPGVYKIDFQRRKIKETEGAYAGQSLYFYPKSKLGSYTSIMGNTGLNQTSDMYAYMRDNASSTLKKVYYTALGRERWSSFHVNNIGYDIDLSYFLDSY